MTCELSINGALEMTKGINALEENCNHIFLYCRYRRRKLKQMYKKIKIKKFIKLEQKLIINK